MKQSIFSLNVIIIFSFILTLIYFFSTPLVPDPQYRWTMVILAIISTISYFFIRKYEYRDIHWLGIAPIFILGYLIVFYQMTFLDLMGFELPKRFYYFIWADESVVNKSVGVATLGLLAFYIGTISIKNNIMSKKQYLGYRKISTKSISFVLILAYIFYILFFISAGSYASGVYSAQDASGLANYFYKLFDVSISAAIIIKVTFSTSFEDKRLSFKKYLLNFGKPLLVLLFWHLLFSLYVGDRGPIITYSLLAFGLYFIRWKRLNVLYIIITFFVLSGVMTMIGEARQSKEVLGVGYLDRVVETYNAEKSSKFFDTYVPGSQTLELAGSVNTLNYSLFNVPDKYDYRYGLIQLQYLYSIIPGMSSRINTVFFDGDAKKTSSALFITYLIQGSQASYGNGMSILADFYLDFGVFGVIVGLYLFGYFVRQNEPRLFSGCHRPTLLWVATLIFFANALYLNRSSIGLELANIVLIYIFIKINIIFVSYYNKKRIGNS